MSINKCTILEATREAIQESLEWGTACSDNSFGYFVDGIMAVTDILLAKLNETEPDCSLERAFKESIKGGE